MNCLLRTTTTLIKYCGFDRISGWSCITTSSPFYYCDYTTSTYSITTTIDLGNLPYLIYVLGGLFLFFVALFFIDFLRRTIR
jgi:hypothetical protein